MARRKRDRWAGIIIGPSLVVCAVAGLWKNETRFDYHRAASDTRHIASPTDGTSGELISLTGSMDSSITFEGDYVSSFTGFLMVRRTAEIYAWDEDRSDDRTTWSTRWMDRLESNSRNSALEQALSSSRFTPPSYTVGELPVDVALIEFVDRKLPVDPATLEVQREGLVVEGTYLYLRKGEASGLGDERVAYAGIPVPEIATYFGKLEAQRAVADTRHRRTGFVSKLIRDSGILHHVVAGQRETALSTMKAHIGRLKWVIRGIGSGAVVFGFFILFSTIVGFLYHLPIIGGLVQFGTFAGAVALGIPIAAVTIVTSYLVAHPIILAVALGLLVVAFLAFRNIGKSSQAAVKRRVDERYGQELDEADVKDHEFLELAQLAMTDSGLGKGELAWLQRWSKKHGWDDAKRDEMLANAARLRESSGTTTSDEHLSNLVELALADGSVSRYEMKSIRQAAQKLGYSRSKMRSLVRSIRQRAAVAPASG